MKKFILILLCCVIFTSCADNTVVDVQSSSDISSEIISSEIVSSTIVATKNLSDIADAISASAFIGIIAAFVAQALAGQTKDHSSDAGFMSVVCLVLAVVISLVFEFICIKFKWKKLEVFATPLSIFGSLAIAILLIQTLPAEITSFVWR